MRTPVSPARHPPTKLSSPEFDRASDFLRARSLSKTDATRRLPWYLDIGGAVAVAKLIRALPVLDVQLTAAPTGLTIRRELAGKVLAIPRVRICAAVLDVPRDMAERPSGKRNQALRTALTAARAAGMTIRPVADPDARREIAARIVDSAPWRAEWSQTVQLRVTEDWLVAFDSCGTPVGVCAAVIDRYWASLVTLIGAPGSPLQSHARYALHHDLLRLLSQRGISHLGAFEHSPLLLPPKIRHLQRILGYLPTRLREPVDVSDPINEGISRGPCTDQLTDRR